jgi:hypothetical protein
MLRTSLKLHLAAYRPELEVAVAMAHSFLPFAISLPPKSALPDTVRISKYKAILSPYEGPKDGTGFRLQDFHPLPNHAASVALALAPNRSGILSISQLYDWVCGGSDTAVASSDLVLVQSIRYNSHSGETSWWMDSERAGIMQKEKWAMGLVRLDGWGPHGKVFDFKVQEIERWSR